MCFDWWRVVEWYRMEWNKVRFHYLVLQKWNGMKWSVMKLIPSNTTHPIFHSLIIQLHFYPNLFHYLFLISPIFISSLFLVYKSLSSFLLCITRIEKVGFPAIFTNGFELWSRHTDTGTGTVRYVYADTWIF